MPSAESLTPTSLLAAATDFLIQGDYVPIPDAVLGEFGLDTGRAFEDAYGVVVVIVYDTWDELRSTWPDHQGALVALLSAHVPRVEAKAWEGYLVLLTLGGISEEAESESNSIRYNMTRVRKLVGIGSELQTLTDLERVLRPLLPVRPRELSTGSESALELLPGLLASESVPEESIRAAIAAFQDSLPIVEAIHESRRS